MISKDFKKMMSITSFCKNDRHLVKLWDDVAQKSLQNHTGSNVVPGFWYPVQGSIKLAVFQ